MNAEYSERRNTTESNSQATNEISIINVLMLVIQHWWVIAMVGAIFAIAVYAYSKTTSVPTYRSTGNLYIDTQREQKNEDVNATALINTVNLMPSYVEVLSSRTFCSQISDDIDNKYSYSEIQKMLNLTQVVDTNIMEVTVTCADKSDSYAICNSFVEHASDEVLRIFEGGSVKIIDRPEQEPMTIAANSYKRGVIGFVIGVILAVFALFLLDMFDTRIEGSEELIEKYGLPILGEIPNLSDV